MTAAASTGQGTGGSISEAGARGRVESTAFALGSLGVLDAAGEPGGLITLVFPVAGFPFGQ